MSRRDQAAALSQFVTLAKSLELQRYRLGIVCGTILSVQSEIIHAVSIQLQGRYVDLATDLLPQTVRPDFAPTLGAFGPENLIAWMLEQVSQAETYMLVIGQIEPLLATFGRERAKQFFQMAAQVEPRSPIIIVTYLKKQVEEAKFPLERLLHI